MPERIYNLIGDRESATLNEFLEEPFSEEDALQELIARSPELLAGEQMNPEDPPRWILISREAGITDQVDGTARWSLDHALIDQHGVPTLVETKRGDSRELRRTIVGQMLDYAAHASKYWSADELRKQFEQHEDAEFRLADLLAEEEPGQEEFWNLVDTNLNAKNLRLLFVADRIPDELATVVEFLNEQMQRIEVLAVEIKQFRGDSGRILVPRVIGRLASTSAQSSRRATTLNRASFLAGIDDADVRSGAETLLDTAEAHGARLRWGTSAVSIRVRHQLWPQEWLTIGWLCPTPGQPGWNNIQDLTFGWTSGWYDIDPDSPLKQRLDRWARAFAEDTFSTRLEANGLDAWWVAHEDAPAHIQTLSQRLASVLDDLAQL
ncbi:MAG: hypothetical protein OXH38_02240 [Chloroflexi bacterium]|nr:hypothetical protein [Chloroflexota bacterium]